MGSSRSDSRVRYIASRSPDCLLCLPHPSIDIHISTATTSLSSSITIKHLHLHIINLQTADRTTIQRAAHYTTHTGCVCVFPTAAGYRAVTDVTGLYRHDTCRIVRRTVHDLICSTMDSDNETTDIGSFSTSPQACMWILARPYCRYRLTPYSD